MKKVLLLDISILCVYLGIPGKDVCGKGENQWNQMKVKKLLQVEETAKTTFILPLAAIIETGNHIAQTNTRRYELAEALANVMRLSADSTTPWAAFTEQSILWEVEGLRQLADEFPNLASQGFSIGDATIKRVAEHYAKSGFHVEILTCDAGLKAYEPLMPTPIPRRRKKN